MPFYEYECKNCSNRFEKLQPIASDPIKICPQCGEEQVRRIIQPVGVIFKGSGWYITDTRKPEASEGSSGSSGRSGSSSSSSDKPAEDSTSSDKPADKPAEKSSASSGSDSTASASTDKGSSASSKDSGS